MGHSHGEHAPVEVGQRARALLVGFLAVVGILAVAGMIWLWPSGAELDGALTIVDEVPGVTYEDATITGIVEGCESAGVGPVEGPACLTAQVVVDSGADEGAEVAVELSGPQVHAGLKSGDSIEVARIPTEDGFHYAFSGVNRLPVIGIMLALFVAAVVAVARWRGLMALVALGIAAYVLLGFMLPAVIVGKSGMAVALAGSTVIMFIVLYVAHGVSVRTSAALAGTLLGLAVTTGLGAIAVVTARLSGFSDENEYDLAQLAPAINFQDLLMVGIIVGGLGVLNDVTITQASAVWELRGAAPQWSRSRVFAAGMRIGRDHIASTIYTIVFAYAGAALTVLLLLYFTSRAPLDLLGVEMFAGEAVRTLGSAIGLVLSVPLTTGIAALTVGPAKGEVPAAEASPVAEI
ncbi:YibE/F family protein [Tessaracoccus sp. MC1756]|uniref:YibE/F family protein n=1 Tax=Tessaracoccus sp. MC1756 TaxID=2760311 RepID=UPI0015FF36BF|nr:YibE/F family protein [Tessaracoccus sp. MC1756]MBB1510445.1 YibE/F family protein [Tessaracoccus sp. MC1756]